MSKTSRIDRRRRFVLALLCSAFFMVILDVAIVNVALPSIQTDLGFSPPSLQWVVSAYALTFGGLLLLGGRAADLLGRRRVFVGGVAVFALASLLGGLAWLPELLVAARALQGVGAAAMTPAALSILMTTFPEGAERNKALGAWGGIAAGIFGLKTFGGMGTFTVDGVVNHVNFMSQLLGTLLGVAVALAGGFIVYGVIRQLVGIRLDPEQEFNGADLSIHKISSTPFREEA